jgi:hypothetical protein
VLLVKIPWLVLRCHIMNTYGWRESIKAYGAKSRVLCINVWAQGKRVRYPWINHIPCHTIKPISGLSIIYLSIHLTIRLAIPYLSTTPIPPLLAPPTRPTPFSSSNSCRAFVNDPEAGGLVLLAAVPVSREMTPAVFHSTSLRQCMGWRLVGRWLRRLHIGQGFSEACVVGMGWWLLLVREKGGRG